MGEQIQMEKVIWLALPIQEKELEVFVTSDSELELSDPAWPHCAPVQHHQLPPQSKQANTLVRLSEVMEV